MYTLKALSQRALQRGRKFVVCDAGGGTVDLISYEVMRVDKLEVREVTEGTGGKCGSSMLNMRFRRHLKQTHGERYWTDDRLVLALNEFESVSGNPCHCSNMLFLIRTVQKNILAQWRTIITKGRS